MIHPAQVLVTTETPSSFWTQYGDGIDPLEIRRTAPNHPLLKDFRLFAPEFLFEDVIFVATLPHESGRKVEGLAQITLSECDPSIAAICFIEVPGRDRAQGIASAIVDRMFEWAAANGISAIHTGSYTALGEMCIRKKLQHASEVHGVLLEEAPMRACDFESSR